MATIKQCDWCGEEEPEHNTSIGCLVLNWNYQHRGYFKMEPAHAADLCDACAKLAKTVIKKAWTKAKGKAAR